MKYASIFATSFFLVSAVALAILLAPDIWRDYTMRGQTLFHAKKHEIEKAGCDKSIPYIALCDFTIRQKLGSPNRQTLKYLIFGVPRVKRLLLLQSRAGQLTTSLGRAYLRNRILVFFSCNAFLALLVVVSLSGVGFRFSRRKNYNAVKYDMDQLQHLAAHIHVPDNPIDVWQRILNGSELSWVVCNRGTLVMCDDDGQPPEQTAYIALDQLAFSEERPDNEGYAIYLNPDYGVWIISYPGSSILNYVKLSDTIDENMAIQIGRECSARDAFEKRICYIERRMKRQR